MSFTTRSELALRKTIGAVALGVAALIACFLALPDPALAFTMGLLPPSPVCASSVIQFEGVSAVPQPPPAPGSFAQTACVSAPDFANSLFSRAIPGVLEGVANMSFGVGSFGALVTAAGTSLPDDPAAVVAVAAFGTIDDQLIISGGSGKGTMLLPLRLTGSVGMTSVVPVAFIEAGFSFACGTISITTFGEGAACGGSFKLDPGGEAQFVFDDPQTISRTFLMTIPFTFGDEFILRRTVMLAAGLGCVDCSATVSGDFRDTGVLEKATVLDSSGREVPGAIILSLSGFDYLNPATAEPPGVPGPGPGGSVPAPGTLAMVACGSIMLALRRRWNFRRVR
jgi:hypothetical protein